MFGQPRAALVARMESRCRSHALDGAVGHAPERRSGQRGEQRESDARGAGVDDRDRSLHGALPTIPCAVPPLRRACTSIAITAHEASRDLALSARLVNTIGTRAPSTMPAASASARYSSCLA